MNYEESLCQDIDVLKLTISRASEHCSWNDLEALDDRCRTLLQGLDQSQLSGEGCNRVGEKIRDLLALYKSVLHQLQHRGESLDTHIEQLNAERDSLKKRVSLH